MKEELTKELFGKIYQLLPVFKKSILKPHQVLNYHRLTTLQHMALMILRDNLGMNMNTLANTLGIKKQQLTKLIQSLEEIELVEKRINPTNKREINLYLTEIARERLTVLETKAYNTFKEKADRLSEQELIKHINNLNALLEFLDSTEEQN